MATLPTFDPQAFIGLEDNEFVVILTAEDVLGLSAAVTDSKRTDESFPGVADEHPSVAAARDDAWAKIQIAYLAHREDN